MEGVGVDVVVAAFVAVDVVGVVGVAGAVGAVDAAAVVVVGVEVVAAVVVAVVEAVAVVEVEVVEVGAADGRPLLQQRYLINIAFVKDITQCDAYFVPHVHLFIFKNVCTMRSITSPLFDTK